MVGKYRSFVEITKYVQLEIKKNVPIFADICTEKELSITADQFIVNLYYHTV